MLKCPSQTLKRQKKGFKGFKGMYFSGGYHPIGGVKYGSRQVQPPPNILPMMGSEGDALLSRFVKIIAFTYYHTITNL